ncbi:unnamed protein product [Arctia plantaginis]|uniref:Uncharacterized protein n=1 Tax=Arctia plantaginis TaxID=874455 RepID=A0A8S1AXX4_ARCPL|nr:unnamed protein product [Arctia plantaginis]
MSAKLNTFFLLLLQATLILSELPPIQKCSLGDSDCLQKSAQNVVSVFSGGIPELSVEPLEPVHIDIINIDLSGLKLTVKDAEIKGLSKSTIDKVQFDSSKKVMQFAFNVPIVLKGKYKASGKLLILPISGDGDITLKIKKIEIFLTMVYEIIKNENGKDVIDLKSYKFTYENRVNTHFKLTNLFNGNKVLSDAMHSFMNDQWAAITQEFGIPMLEKPVKKIFNAIKTYLRSQPLEEIAII